MGKILLLIAVVAVIYYFLRSKRKDDPSFVQCDKCKTFVSINEAKKKSGKYICSECMNDSHR